MKNRKRWLFFVLSAVLILIAGGAAITSKTVTAADLPKPYFKPYEWFDYYHGEQMPPDGRRTIHIPQYDITVEWTPENVTAKDDNREVGLFWGMPIWNVYIADLHGNGYPTLCATVSVGSGIVDTRVIAYTWAGDEYYELSDRAYYDYSLSLENGKLMVTQTKSQMGAKTGEVRGIGELALIDGELTAVGINRSKLFAPPPTAEPPYDAASTLSEGYYQVIRFLYDMDNGLKGEKYFAVDMAGVTEGERETLKTLLTPWVEYLGCELLIDSYEGLVASGHIIDMSSDSYDGGAAGFIDGVLISLENASFDGETLTVTAEKYCSPIGAIGADFTVKFINGNWVVEGSANGWVA